MDKGNKSEGRRTELESKNLERDRLVFFCDAVVAIAITLLVIDLKIEGVKGEHLTFSDLLQPWHRFLAFILSFLNIASFWKSHHNFYVYIKKIDDKFLWYNVFWLFFIVLLPFTTSLISDYFFDVPAMFAYCLNIFLITIFQNNIWDYASFHPQLLRENTLTDKFNERIRLYCNFDMVNGLIAIIVSFFSPVTAFILLSLKIPMIIAVSIYFRGRFGKLKMTKADYTKEENSNENA